MKKIIFCSFFLLFICFNLSPAQVVISYLDASNNPLAAEPIPTCGESKLYVRLDIQSSLDSIEVEINFPEGTTYVPGSVTKTGGTSTEIVINDKDITNLKRPKFKVTGPLDPAAMLTFSVQRTAGCRAYYLANIATPKVVQKDSVYCSWNGGAVSDENPNLNYYNT